ncbi:hypothetical protein [Brevundimonas sp.]|uniref:hypothetical protein n=1 Tax=Brevundimonas sp. TaxID=1871086 RepID=UPI0028A260D3|nr:hypothetical protein [Brevundimonas sp.]
MSADAFIASVRSSLRRSLFQRLKPLGLSQDEVNRMVTMAVSRAIVLTGVQDLALIAAATGPVVDALATAEPDSPALANFNTVRDGVGTPIRDLVERVIEL